MSLYRSSSVKGVVGSHSIKGILEWLKDGGCRSYFSYTAKVTSTQKREYHKTHECAKGAFTYTLIFLHMSDNIRWQWVSTNRLYCVDLGWHTIFFARPSVGISSSRSQHQERLQDWEVEDKSKTAVQEIYWRATELLLDVYGLMAARNSRHLEWTFAVSALLHHESSFSGDSRQWQPRWD